MNITWTSYDHGREGELTRLNNIRNDYNKARGVRRSADRNHRKIVEQLKDKKLMNLRERLIRAAQAGDFVEQAKIQQLMREHQGEDKETGLYEQR